jgi:hypothetical protein
MLRASTLRLVLALVLLATGLSAPAALGYQGQVPTNVTVTGPTEPVICGTTYEIQALVLDTFGNKVADQGVVWTEFITPVGAMDVLSPSVSNTDANGIARTRITFGGVTGNRTIRATAASAFGQIVLNPTNCLLPPRRLAGPCASARGVEPAAGPYTTDTKVQIFGRYVTWKLSFGVAYAGMLVVVTRAVRDPSVVGTPILWSEFGSPSARMADANGDVYFHFRASDFLWISVRGFFPGGSGLAPKITLACQARWFTRAIP